MFTKIDNAYKIGCGRLIFEDHAMDRLPDEIKRLGRKVYLVTGEHAWAADGDRVSDLLNRAGIPFKLDVYIGPCSVEKANEIAAECKKQDCDIVMGLGGGRIMDLAKTAANVADLHLINVPTIAATCASYTPLAIMYFPDWAYRCNWYFKREIDCVICDISILSREQKRYLAAGILDSMAKWVEINHFAYRVPDAGPDELLARSLAKGMYDELMRDCLSAIGGDAKAIRNIVFHNIVTTGIISGIARGAFQAALAHALYYAVRAMYPKESKPILHGEIVSVGMLFQALYLGNTEQEKELRDLMVKMNMPLSLKDIHVPTDAETLRAFAGYPAVTKHYYENGLKEEDAIKLLESLKQ